MKRLKPYPEASKMIEVKITNKEGVVVIRRPVKALLAVSLALPQVYVSDVLK